MTRSRRSALTFARRRPSRSTRLRVHRRRAASPLPRAAPRNAIGWLLLAGRLLATSLGGVTVDACRARRSHAPGARRGVARRVDLAGRHRRRSATFGLLLFPDGRLPSRRWRPVAWLAAAALVALRSALARSAGAASRTPRREPARARRVPWLPDLLAAAGGAALLRRRSSARSPRCVARYRRAARRRAPAAQVAALRGGARRSRGVRRLAAARALAARPASTSRNAISR